MRLTRVLTIALAVTAGAPAAFAQSELRAQSEDGAPVSLPLVRESYRIDIDQQYASAVLRP